MSNKLERRVQEWCEMYMRWDALYHECAAQSGLSDVAFMLLDRLYTFEKPMTQSEAAEQFHMAKQTINSAVSGLIRQGYVSFEVREGYKKSKWICLTEKGKRFCETEMIRIHELEINVYHRFSAEEQDQYLKLEKQWFSFLEEEVERVMKEKMAERK